MLSSIVKVLATVLLAASFMLSAAPQTNAQPLPIIGFDPFGNPICASPMGPVPCMAMPPPPPPPPPPMNMPVPQIGFDPMFGPICMGPLGPGPCAAVIEYLEMLARAQPANPMAPLTVIDPSTQFGPMCNGPSGQLPCDLAQQAVIDQLDPEHVRSSPLPNLDSMSPQQVALRCAQEAELNVAEFASCAGHNIILPDRDQHVIDCTTSAATDRDFAECAAPVFGISLGENERVMAGCAMKSGGDEQAFVHCAGSAMSQNNLSAEARAMLECADGWASASEDVLGCVGDQFGDVTEQIDTARCALDAAGDAEALFECAGADVLRDQLGEEEQALLDCAASAFEKEDFSQCVSLELDMVLTPEQQAVADCALNSEGDEYDFLACAGGPLAQKYLKGDALAILECAENLFEEGEVLDCAARRFGPELSDDQRLAAECALQSGGDAEEMLTCAGSGVLSKHLGAKERAVLGCAVNASDTSDFAGCAGSTLLGSNLSKEQRIAIQCAAESDGDATMAATCAGANLLNMNLNPEQQIAVQCVVSTGGQPYAAAGCIATRLTARELLKCATDGFGGDGCFGDNNDLVGKDGWVARTLGQVAGGPNSVINNPDQIWGGSNSFVRNPDQIWGGDNSFVRNPGQIFGGDNSVINNPSQLVPEPVTLGEVGGRRICIPWC